MPTPISQAPLEIKGTMVEKRNLSYGSTPDYPLYLAGRPSGVAGVATQREITANYLGWSTVPNLEVILARFQGARLGMVLPESRRSFFRLCQDLSFHTAGEGLHTGMLLIF